MKTILAAAVLMVASMAMGATFDPVTGNGDATRAEIQAAYGWTDAEYDERECQLNYIVNDKYTVVISTAMGPKTLTVDVRYYRTVPSDKVSGGVHFTGFNVPKASGFGGSSVVNQHGRIPQIGDFHLGGPITSVSAPVKTDALMIFAETKNAVVIKRYGWRNLKY